MAGQVSQIIVHEIKFSREKILTKGRRTVHGELGEGQALPVVELKAKEDIERGIERPIIRIYTIRLTSGLGYWGKLDSKLLRVAQLHLVPKLTQRLNYLKNLAF